MIPFNNLLELLEPKKEYEPVIGKCEHLWNSFSSERQDFIFRTIQEKKERKMFVDYNPLFAIQKNSTPPEPQKLSFADYYAKYGTTEEKDGWHMVNPTGNKVMYVKRNSVG